MPERLINKGDTLGAIAQQSGVSVQDILKANQGSKAIGFTNGKQDADKIFAGFKLNIPGQAPTTRVEPTVKPTDFDQNKIATPEPDGDKLDSSLRETSTATALLSQQQGKAEENVSKLDESIMGILGEFRGQEQFQQDKAAELGIPEVEKEIRDLENTLLAKTTALEAGLRDIEGKPLPARLMSAEQRALRSQEASEISALTAAVKLKRGELIGAEADLDRAIDLKFEPLKIELKMKERLLNNAESALADIDKSILAEIKAAQKEEADDIKAQEADFKTSIGYLKDALKGGMPASEYSRMISAINRGEMEPEDVLGSTASYIEKDSVKKESESDELDDADVQSWVQAINDGEAKITNVPAKLKTEVLAAVQQSKPKQKFKSGLTTIFFGGTRDNLEELGIGENELTAIEENLAQGFTLDEIIERSPTLFTEENTAEQKRLLKKLIKNI